MRVLLLKNVPKVGTAGSVVTVAEGYARNFLFPKKLASVATDDAVAVVAANKARQVRGEQLRLQAAEKAKRKLSRTKYQLSKSANEHGTLFAAVSATEIAELVSKHKYPVSVEQVVISKPLKTIGEHTVHIRLETGERVPVTVILQSQA